jgi:CSLREA domain-containing protein
MPKPHSVSLPRIRGQSSLLTLHLGRSGRLGRRRLRFGAVLGVMVLALFVQGQAASAATITATTIADEVSVDGNCSLREAIQAGWD